jgi:tRNA pseudouridine55 synthase
MDGLLVIDKPAGPTSHDVVALVRRVTGWQKVGHTGTLDPMATGVLPLVVGRATRLARFFSASDKVYEAEVRLGWATDTYDATGTPATVTSGSAVSEWPAAEVLESLLAGFRGTCLQSPPPFSARKVEGVRAYALARKGAPVEPRRTEVTLHDITVLGCEDDRLRLRVHCSAGFYVRSFAHELGLAAGPGAHLSALRRTRSGDWDLAAAASLKDLEAVQARARLIPIDRLLTSLPTIVVTAEGAVRARHGNDLRPCHMAAGEGASVSGSVRVVDESGTLLAIGEPGARPGVLHPGVVVV